MVKDIKKIFRNLISKKSDKESGSRLEIDAVPVAAAQTDQNEARTQSSAEAQSLQLYERNDSDLQLTINRFGSSSQNSSIVPSRVNSLIDSQAAESLPSPSTNTNVAEINNVQNNFTFSNIQGFHMGNSVVIHNNLGGGGSGSANNDIIRNRNLTLSGAAKQTSSDNKSNKIRITPAIEMLFTCRDDVEETVLNELSEHVGKNYSSLMRNLGLTQAQIEIVELDFNTIGHKEIIFQLLLKWCEEFFEIANYGKLSRNLWRSDCREAVVKLEEILAKRNSNNVKKETDEPAENLK